MQHYKELAVCEQFNGDNAHDIIKKLKRVCNTSLYFERHPLVKYIIMLTSKTVRTVPGFNLRCQYDVKRIIVHCIDFIIRHYRYINNETLRNRLYLFFNDINTNVEYIELHNPTDVFPFGYILIKYGYFIYARGLPRGHNYKTS